MVPLFFLVAFTALPMPVSGQPQTLRAETLVIINSASASKNDFTRYIQPYLDHFGVPYTVVDIASTDLPGDLSSYALLIIGHNLIDVDGIYLTAEEQNLLVQAVNKGTGLVNFDRELADASLDGLYPYVQDIFGFDYLASSAAMEVVVRTDVRLGEYIIGAQPEGATYSLNGNITPLGIVIPPQAVSLVTVGGHPLLVATTSGQGRAVQWTSYDWLEATTWGYVHGFDDLVWRAMVWAARKPYVMQGLPPFVTLRVDDGAGPYGWVDTANQYGLKPWVGLFLDEQDQTDTADIKSLIHTGGLTVSIHARTQTDFFYYEHDNHSNFPDSVIIQNFADGTAWHEQNQIPISTFVVPHYYEFGTNVFSGLKEWGVEFVATLINPGEPYYSSPTVLAGPFHRYELPCNTPCEQPLYYADYFTVPGQPEFDGQFYNVLTEVRDNAGYEWYPSNDVALTIDRGLAQLRRALDGMELATLFTHEYFIQDISSPNWDAILQGVTAGIASYQPEYVTIDYAAQYVRAIDTSKIASSVYDPMLAKLDTTLTGYTDLTTRFYLFTEQSGQIEQDYVNVPAFTGNILVPTIMGIEPTTTIQPTGTPTPELSPTYASTPTPGMIQINLWEDTHQDPVLDTTTDVGALSPSDDQWTEFLWPVRGYPGVFASYEEDPPLMRFYGQVPNGIYTLMANLYWSHNLRYYWGYSASDPEQYSIDVTGGLSLDFAEYPLGTIMVTDGVLELYVQRADPLPGGVDYPYWGWSWVRLIPPEGSATPTSEPTSDFTPIPSQTDTSTPTPVPVTPTATPTPIFGDVPFDHWAHDYIAALFNAGYVAGCSANPRLYCPENILSRAESSVFVLRGAYGNIPDPPYPTPTTPTFADVDPAFWGFGWIESLWTDGFTAGCGINPLIYCPNQQHTRAEGSVFFLRILHGVNFQPPAPVGLFADVDLGAWYAGWVEAAFNDGLLPACASSPLSFCPEDQLDRAWAAFMMVQAKGGLPLPLATSSVNHSPSSKRYRNELLSTKRLGLNIVGNKQMELINKPHFVLLPQPLGPSNNWFAIPIRS